MVFHKFVSFLISLLFYSLYVYFHQFPSLFPQVFGAELYSIHWDFSSDVREQVFVQQYPAIQKYCGLCSWVAIMVSPALLP